MAQGIGRGFIILFIGRVAVVDDDRHEKSGAIGFETQTKDTPFSISFHGLYIYTYS
jgi:hypothetical protein